MANVILRAPRILCMSGSVRSGSFNEQLVRVSQRLLADKGAAVSVLDLRKAPLPLFSEEVEAAGVPEGLPEMKSMMAQADGLLVASPEYNGSISPLLCNTLSWLSRTTGGEPDEPMYASFKGKAGVVVAASPGGLGGLRGLSHVREVLTNLGVNVLPEQVAIGGAFQAFDGDALKNETQASMLDVALTRLFETARNVANQEAVCELAKQHKLYGQYGEIVASP